MIWHLVPDQLSEIHRVARRRRPLSQAVALWAKPVVRFIVPSTGSWRSSPIERLEARQLLAGYPNIVVAAPAASQNNAVDLYTYNPNTVNPTNPQPTGFPIPVLNQPGTDGPARGIGYDDNGDIDIYNGSNKAILTTYSPGSTTPFTNHTATKNQVDGNPIGWSTLSNNTNNYFGGLAEAGQYIFVTDMLTGTATLNDTRGLIRFDGANNYQTAELETDAENGKSKTGIPLGVDFVDVSLGLNDIVYAVAPPNAFDTNWSLYEFNIFDPLNPAVFDQIAAPIDLVDPRTNTPLTNVTDVTADGNGDLYIGSTSSSLLKVNATDTTFLATFPAPGYNATDLQFDTAGDLLATSGRNVVVLNENLVAQVSFNLPVSASATFATWAAVTPTPTPPTPTPTPTTPTPTPTPTPSPPPLPVPPGVDTIPPVATLVAGNTFIGQLPVYVFKVAYTDNYAVDPNSPGFQADDPTPSVTVTLPDGTSETAQLTAVLGQDYGPYGYLQEVATYQIPAVTEVGDYTVTLQPDQIDDVAGNITPGQGLGAFAVTQPEGQVTTGPAPDLVPEVVSKLPGSVVAGAKGSVKLLVANEGTAPVDSPVQITLFVSPDPALDTNETALAPPYVVNLKIPVKKTKVVKLRFNYPQFLSAGGYYFLADVNSNMSLLESDYSDDVFVSPSTIVISPAYVDLGASFPPHRAATFNVGQDGLEAVTVSNFGNVAASGLLTIDLSAISAGATPTQTGTLLAFSHNINLAPGVSQTFKIKVPLSGLAAGTYNFVADVDPLNTFNESTLTNNIATDPQPFTSL